ncbi:CLUMA_CG006778, isoform A [Clunio marinus]|uniref:CLUMA_CG006778, isoform A n=1 Tax=Clunio marinus TaxID=568069 RepID=A0A1J1I0D3_9DIPT|nr:CLUMA_CG006778, isoform A [Clunio marinus]
MKKADCCELWSYVCDRIFDFLFICSISSVEWWGVRACLNGSLVDENVPSQKLLVSCGMFGIDLGSIKSIFNFNREDEKQKEQHKHNKSLNKMSNIYEDKNKSKSEKGKFFHAELINQLAVEKVRCFEFLCLNAISGISRTKRRRNVSLPIENKSHFYEVEEITKIYSIAQSFQPKKFFLSSFLETSNKSQSNLPYQMIPLPFE